MSENAAPPIISATLGELTQTCCQCSSPGRSAPKPKSRPPIEAAIFYKREPPKINAAPFPMLPSKSDVIRLISQKDSEIRKLKEELRLLLKIRQAEYMDSVDFEKLNPELGIQVFYGMITPHRVIEKVEQENSEKIKAAKDRYSLKKSSTEHTYNHISHLPYINQTIAMNIEICDWMFKAVLGWRTISYERMQLLARQYAEQRKIWEKYSDALEEFQHEKRELLLEWPNEFVGMPIKPKEKSLYNNLVAQDQPMFLDDSEFYSGEFYSMNGFVEDPVAEHKEYKKRLCWTKNEIQIFLDKYRLHPRDFKKISACLPQKSVKDVIEFYFIHRIDLDLKLLEKQNQKRERRKRVSEGPVKK